MDQNKNTNKLVDLLLYAYKQGASDLHLAVNKKPLLRIDGSLKEVGEYTAINVDDMADFVAALLTDRQEKILLEKKEIDFSFSLQDKIRFRANVFYQQGLLSCAFRLIPFKVMGIDELMLPSTLHRFAKMSQGFVLFVGPAGQGKSTSLAAIIDEINHSRCDHIVTIEDPIEYIFESDKSLISQREVGMDTMSFHSGLKTALRQDPDVLMIGEMRDKTSVEIALKAAETGHLVISTLHTNSASQTINRIIDFFPAEQQNQIRSQLAMNLTGIVSQRLIPKINGGRIPACEVMFGNSAISNLIRTGKVYQIDMVIETSVKEGMMSMNRSLIDLVQRKEISVEKALDFSYNPNELKSLLQ